MLSVIMQSAIIMSGIMTKVNKLSVFMLSVIMMSGIMRRVFKLSGHYDEWHYEKSL